MIQVRLPEFLEPVREFLHEFARERIRPVSREADETGRVPEDLLKEVARFAGGRAWFGRDEDEPGSAASGEARPAEGGEEGRRSFPVNLVGVVGAEELAWGDASVILNLPGPGLAGPAIMAAGTRDQKKRFLKDLFDTEELRYGALAVTEPHAGSDVSAIRTRATREGDWWVLNGTKIFCTNGARAEIVVVNATIDPSLGREGQKLFVVPRGTPGFRVGKIEKKLGLRASETAELIFEDCRIPFDHILGEEEALKPKTGFKGTMQTFDASRPAVAAMAVGIGRASYEYARDWAYAEFPRHSPRWAGVLERLAETRRELQVARLLSWQAAWMLDQRIPNSKEASMAKAYAAQAAWRACVTALTIMGPEGYSKEHLVEKGYRDVKCFDIFEGTGQIQRVVISRRILGRLEGET